MGASQFIETAHGEDAQQAFRIAVEDAQYESGHGGYTGTIAEKDGYGFRMVELPRDKDAREYVDELFDDEGHFCQDKWGPAACIQVGPTEFIFFGWASS